jgi:hypothetical protein
MCYMACGRILGGELGALYGIEAVVGNDAVSMTDYSAGSTVCVSRPIGSQGCGVQSSKPRVDVKM